MAEPAWRRLILVFIGTLITSPGVVRERQADVVALVSPAIEQDLGSLREQPGSRRTCGGSRGPADGIWGSGRYLGQRPGVCRRVSGKLMA